MLEIIYTKKDVMLARVVQLENSSFTTIQYKEKDTEDWYTAFLKEEWCHVSTDTRLHEWLEDIYECIHKPETYYGSSSPLQSVPVPIEEPIPTALRKYLTRR